MSPIDWRRGRVPILVIQNQHPLKTLRRIGMQAKTARFTCNRQLFENALSITTRVVLSVTAVRSPPMIPANAMTLVHRQSPARRLVR